MTVAEANQHLLAAGLRPLWDPFYERFLADCPVCDAGASDPSQMYRPLRFHAIHGWECQSGCSPHMVLSALIEPPVDWEAVAMAYRALALRAVARLAEQNPPVRLRSAA